MMKTGNETKPSNDLPPIEKLKFYTDLYKFYSEMPFKIVAAYSVASGLILNVVSNFTKSPRIMGLLVALIVGVGFLIGIQIYKFDAQYLEPYKDEIESLTKRLGIKIRPNFQMTRFIFRLTVVLLLLVPLGAVLLLVPIITR
jgi:hypothetical protein